MRTMVVVGSRVLGRRQALEDQPLTLLDYIVPRRRYGDWVQALKAPGRPGLPNRVRSDPRKRLAA